MRTFDWNEPFRTQYEDWTRPAVDHQCRCPETARDENRSWYGIDRRTKLLEQRSKNHVTPMDNSRKRWDYQGDKSNRQQSTRKAALSPTEMDERFKKMRIDFKRDIDVLKALNTDDPNSYPIEVAQTREPLEQIKWLQGHDPMHDGNIILECVSHPLYSSMNHVGTDWTRA